MIRILIGDDHRIVRAGLKQVLAECDDLCVVAEAATGPEVLEQVRSLQNHGGLDLVLLDIALPGMDGLEVLQQLRREHPQLPVLMLSTYPESQYAVRCIRLGAGGYLNKSADPDDMLAAVRQVASGARYLSHATAQALASAIGPVGTGLASLSHREHQVFRLLIVGHTVSEIGAQLGLAANTVSTYRARILEKTGAKNDVELALLAERQSRGPAQSPNAT
jgi:two-component system, NarL family, invasion response regulator UvrY